MNLSIVEKLGRNKRTRRSEISIEEILRTETGLSDIYTTWLLLREEIPHTRQTVFRLAVLTLGEVGSQVLVAAVGKRILDNAISSTQNVNLWLILLAVFFSGAAFVFMRGRLFTQERLALSCRDNAVKRLSLNISQADYKDLASVPMACLREIIMTDIDFAYRFFIDGMTQAVIVAFWLLAALTITLLVSPPLLIVLIVMGIVCSIGIAYGTHKHMALTSEKFRRRADLSQRARDVVEVDRVLLSRQFGIGDFFVRLFLGAHDLFVRVSLAQARLSALVRASMLMLNAAAFLAVVCFGGLMIIAGSLSAGGLVAVLFVVGQLLAAFAPMSDYVPRAAEAANGGKRISAYWDSLDENEKTAEPEKINSISARNVSFGYETGEPVVENIDLTLSRGRLTALTAETGAGKTTLALLLCGIVRPSGGQISINNNEFYRPENLAPGRIIYVGSKPILFEGSVRDNLLFDGESAEYPTAGLEQLFACAKKPLPLDKPIIGPNGTGVSAGQAQLIQLSRVILRDPDFVVFDEATSSLDMETEAAVQEFLLEWCRQRVCLVISHRRCPWTEKASVRLKL